MLGRLLILIAMMLTGPLFIEVYLYHPTIVIEHDKAAMKIGRASCRERV